MMKIETYTLKASNGRHIRQATKIVFDDGRELRLMERVTQKQARQIADDPRYQSAIKHPEKKELNSLEPPKTLNV